MDMSKFGQALKAFSAGYGFNKKKPLAQGEEQDQISPFQNLVKTAFQKLKEKKNPMENTDFSKGLKPISGEMNMEDEEKKKKFGYFA